MRRIADYRSRDMDIDELEEFCNSITIQEKIEFSGITPRQIVDKYAQILERVEYRHHTVLQSMSTKEVAEYWFRNWLHPALKNWVHKPPVMDTYTSAKLRDRDMRISYLRMYENGQMNYDYYVDQLLREYKHKLVKGE